MKTTTSIMKLPTILLRKSVPLSPKNDMWKLASVGYQSTVEESEQIPSTITYADGTGPISVQFLLGITLSGPAIFCQYS
ncbi:hypothetical protein ERIC1_2c05000 [Paenibacillus larvae subsp. larvae DSM 25719]|nr:hypothetical protein ERIC1_2c05000 [Paenibacillus larvae subsp. larvae DSM 25719]